MKTYTVKSEDTSNLKWHLIDAKGLILGRLASAIAKLLLGKHKSIYAPYANIGDYVVVVNANEIKVTGNKSSDKFYYRHSTKPGKLKKTTFDKLIVKSSEELLRLTVKGMLPKNPRGRSSLKKLKVFANSEHNHLAQQPISIEV